MRILTAILAFALSGGPAAQRGGRGGGGPEFGGPPQGPNDVPIVEVVGCLTAGPNSTWMATNATEPAKAPAGFSRPDDVKAAEERALGALQLPLIGMVEMHPEQHRGHKVLVKGLLVKDAAGQRLNVTSLSTVAATCAK
jgi:hypothetical protein